MSLLDINFDGFSLAKLYEQRISCLHVVMKKICNFPQKSELPKFTLGVKLILFCGFQGGNKKFAEIRADSLSSLAALPLDFVPAAMPSVLVLQHKPACRLRKELLQCCSFLIRKTDLFSNLIVSLGIF